MADIPNPIAAARRLGDNYVTFKHVVFALIPALGMASTAVVWTLGEARAAAQPAIAISTATAAKVESAVASVRADDEMAHQKIEASHKELGDKIDHLTDLLLTGQVRVNNSPVNRNGGHR